MAPKVAPPAIAGWSLIGQIGTGGFSEVFEYVDDLGRHVAVKVLIDDATDAEARAMAAVSVHPAIVTIYTTGVSEEGHRYLAMEYYGGDSYADRVASAPVPVDEVLSVGVQLSGALAFAHKNRVLHRDIKPANILTTELGTVGLTDFGIASLHGDGEAQEAVSMPWVPPEVLQGEVPTERADVYALAATLYTMLAGHAPFVIIGGDNSDRALAARTIGSEVPPIARRGVPNSLDGHLRWAMSKDPAQRPQSAEEFGRNLQSIEAELQLAPTRLETQTNRHVRREARPPLEADELDPDRTVARKITVIDADKAPPAPQGSHANLIDGIPVAPVAGGARRRPLAELGVGAPLPAEATRLVARDEPPAGASSSAGSAGSVAAIVGAAIVVVIVAVWVAMAATGGRSGDGERASEPFADTEQTLPLQAVAKVVDLFVERVDPESVRVSWAPPAVGEVSGYQYASCDHSAAIPITTVETTEVVVSGAPEGQSFCVAVSTIASDGRISARTEARL